MHPSHRVLFHEYGTQLRESDGKQLILSVLCGRVAQFGVEFSLNDDERKEYRARGDAFIVELSKKVQEQSGLYAERGRTF